MKIFEEAAIRQAVGMPAAIQAVREAFRADGLRQTQVPSVINLVVPGAEGEFHVKSAWIQGVPHVAVKVASGFYRNPERGLPSGAGLMVLFDAATGMPEALLLDNGYLTDLRTGAAGAVAADLLARRDIQTVGVLGSGIQARHQLSALREVRQFSRVRCWSRNPANAEALCAEIAVRFHVDAGVERAVQGVVEAADVLVTVTPSRVPLVRAEWMKPGLHITAVGSDTPGKQELDAACLSRADLVIADRVAQCERFGELAHGGRAAAELGAVAAGLHPGRSRDDDITIADLTGVGFQDTAIAAAAYMELCSTSTR